jgi:hypothetical protein
LKIHPQIIIVASIIIDMVKNVFRVTGNKNLRNAEIAADQPIFEGPKQQTGG